MGNSFVVYLDVGGYETGYWEVIYLNAGPESSNSVRIVDQDGFKRKIMKTTKKFVLKTNDFLNIWK